MPYKRRSQISGHFLSLDFGAFHAKLPFFNTHSPFHSSCRKKAKGKRTRVTSRRRELLPTPYVHVVFTLPPQLAALALQNRKLIYGLLLRASAETLLEVARNPAHLGAEIGFFSVLHTWNQKLQLNPHS
jgi:hypothetical protein